MSKNKEIFQNSEEKENKNILSQLPLGGIEILPENSQEIQERLDFVKGLMGIGKKFFKVNRKNEQEKIEEESMLKVIEEHGVKRAPRDVEAFFFANLHAQREEATLAFIEKQDSLILQVCVGTDGKIHIFVDGHETTVHHISREVLEKKNYDYIASYSSRFLMPDQNNFSDKVYGTALNALRIYEAVEGERKKIKLAIHRLTLTV